MKTKLANLSITKESHPRLYFFVRQHPEIMQVFHNIEQDLPLDRGIVISHADSPDIVTIYIENLHLPLLLDVNAIRRDTSRKCGYRPLVGGLSFSRYDSRYTARVAADRACALAKASSEQDNFENSLYCYYHGAGEKVSCSRELLAEMRKLILDYATRQDKEEEAPEAEARTFDLVISARMNPV